MTEKQECHGQTGSVTGSSSVHKSRYGYSVIVIAGCCHLMFLPHRLKRNSWDESSREVSTSEISRKMASPWPKFVLAAHAGIRVELCVANTTGVWQVHAVDRWIRSTAEGGAANGE